VLLAAGLSVAQATKIVRGMWGDDDKLRIWCDGRVLPGDYVYDNLSFKITTERATHARIVPKPGTFGWNDWPVSEEQLHTMQWVPDGRGGVRPAAGNVPWPPKPKALEDFVFEIEERQIYKLIPEKIRSREPPGPKPRGDWKNVTRRILSDMGHSLVIELYKSRQLHSALEKKVRDACGFAPKDPDDLNAIVREFLGIPARRDRTPR
jgi:hypothetical protein